MSWSVSQILYLLFGQPSPSAGEVFTQVAIKMHGTFREWEAPTKSRDTIDSLWT
jgi:hypothetical protein